MRNRAAGRGTQSVLQFLTQHLGRACLITKWAVWHISRRFQRPNKSYMGTPSLAVPPHTYPSIPRRIQPCQWLTWNQAHKVVLIMSVYSVGLPGISFLWSGQLLFWVLVAHSVISWVLLGSSATTVFKRGWVFFCLWDLHPWIIPQDGQACYLGPNTLEATIKPGLSSPLALCEGQLVVRLS